MIDVAGGDKVPRKGGPGTRNADLLLINKVDLAPLVGADLAVMRRDAEARRQGRPTVLSNLRAGSGVDTVRAWVVEQLLRHEQAPAHIHSILVQVRGGLVEGDRWRLSALARGGAQAHLRAAGATIVYSGTCFVRTTLCASDGGSLTQRSSGLILRPGASLRAATVIRADAGGTVVATEVIALAEGCGGTLRSVVVRDATPLFEERIGLSEDRSRPWRLGEFSHLGSLIAVGLTRQRRLRALLRDLPPSAGASSPRPGCLLVRALGHSIDELDSLLGGLLEEARG